MEGIVEVDEEELSFSENIIEEEIIGEDGELSYDEEEIEEETIEEETIEEEEESVEYQENTEHHDGDVVFVGKIPPNAEIEMDEWQNHFQKQQEHIFDNSETLLDFYDETRLESVYDMSFSVQEAEATPSSREESSMEEQSTQEPDGDDQQSDNIMKRLAKRREEEMKLQAKDDNENIMKRLAKNVVAKQKKGYLKRKYRRREDPYMEELQETVTTWFRFDDMPNADANTPAESAEPTIGASLVDETVQISENKDLASVEEGVPVVEEDSSQNSDVAETNDTVDESYPGENAKKGDDSEENSSPAEISTISSAVDATKKLNVAIELDDSSSDESEEQADTKVQSTETVTGELDARPTTKNENNIDLTPDIGGEKEEAQVAQDIEIAVAEAAPEENVSQSRKLANKSLEEKEDGVKVSTFMTASTRKVDDTDSTSSDSSDNDDDSSDSSVHLDTIKSRTGKHSISINDPENEEFVNKVLEESHETVMNVDEIMRSIPSATKSLDDLTSLRHAAETNDVPKTKMSDFHREYGSPGNSVLLKFIRKRDWEELKKCMAMLKREDPFIIQQQLTQVDKANSTPLHQAVLKAPPEVTSQLIGLVPFDYREDILMAVDNSGSTPLHVVCEHFDMTTKNNALSKIIKMLALGSPRLHSIRNYAGESPLSLLLASPGAKSLTADPAEDVATDLVQSILKENPGLINQRNDDNSTLLHTAASHCVHDGVLRALLEADDGAPMTRIKDQHGMLPLHNLVSCTNGRIPSARSVKRLVKAYPEAIAEKSSTGDTPLHLFVSNVGSWIPNKKAIASSNTSKVVQALLGNGEVESPLLVRNDEMMFPLHCCVRFKTPLEVVSVLMTDKFSVRASTQRDSNGATPLHVICASPAVAEMVDFIATIGTKEAAVVKDGDKNTPLLVAIANPKVTKDVIRAVGAVNPAAATIENAKGRTPFHAAIRSKLQENVIKEVIKIEPKAVKKVTFKGNNNIFHEMCQHETSTGILTGLLQVHPDGAKGQNDKGNLPLHVAAAYHLSSKVINALIKAHPEGCLVKNKAKEIPLHYAVGDDDAKEKNILALLKAAPESILVKNKEGRTPMDVAKDAEVSVEVYEVLRRHYREQSKEDDSFFPEKEHSRKKKKKSKKVSDPNDSQSSLQAVESPGVLKKKKRKKESIGLYDSMAVFETLNEDKQHESLQGSMNLNDVKGHMNGSSNALHHSSKSKKKKGKEDENGGESPRKRGSMKSGGSSLRSKTTEDKKDLESRKSRRKLGESGEEKSLSRASSKRKSKTSKSSEGASLFTTPKSRKGKLLEKGTPKTPRTSSLIDLSNHAVKTPKSSKSTRRTKVSSPDRDVTKYKDSKTTKNTPKKKKKSKLEEIVQAPTL